MNSSSLHFSSSTHSHSELVAPPVSIAIPTYNEVKNIERVVRVFLATAYNNLVGIYIADGGSTDGTQEIVKRLSLEDPRVHLLHNPLKLQAAGLNLILEQCNGDIFLRADAHSDYAPDYVERCVEALLHSKSLNVGGAQRFVAQNAFQAGIALAAKSWIGSGGAKYRDPNYDGYAETVYLGCFWREALLKLSGYNLDASANEDSELNLRLLEISQKRFFDTSQVTNQDAELNLRLYETSNQAIYISSKIRVWYYPRKSWRALANQYFKYGRGRYLTSTKHILRKQIRGILPFACLSTLIASILVSFFLQSLRLPITLLIAFSFLLIFTESLRVSLQPRRIFASEIWRGDVDKLPSLIKRWLYCGIVLLTMPIAHSCGYGYQVFRRRILGVKGW
jgi:succinoglycan biosynthesis protein ExoA